MSRRVRVSFTWADEDDQEVADLVLADWQSLTLLSEMAGDRFDLVLSGAAVRALDALGLCTRPRGNWLLLDDPERHLKAVGS